MKKLLKITVIASLFFFSSFKTVDECDVTKSEIELVYNKIKPTLEVYKDTKYSNKTAMINYLISQSTNADLKQLCMNAWYEELQRGTDVLYSEYISKYGFIDKTYFKQTSQKIMILVQLRRTVDSI